MVMGFTEQWRGDPTNFVEHVISGRKWHSIRSGTRWRPGMQIQMATGVRTKRYRCFVAAPCLFTQGIKIIPNKPNPGNPASWLPKVMVERGARRVLIALAPFELMALAINDGFENAYDLNRWIFDACRERREEVFRGQIVAWRPVNWITVPDHATPY